MEAHIRTGLNVRHAEEQLRGTIALPHGLGKDVTIAVFAKGDKAREAEEAGADIVGDEDLAKRIEEEGFTDFDVAIATPDMMPVVGRLGRDPRARRARCRTRRSGTVTNDVAKAVTESKAGKVEYRTDRHGHRPPADRQDRLRRAASCSRTTPRSIDELMRAKPAAAKGRYLQHDHRSPRRWARACASTLRAPATSPRRRAAGSLSRQAVPARDPRPSEA